MPRQIFRHLARDLGVLVLPLLFPFQGVYFSTLQLLLYWNNDVPLVTVQPSPIPASGFGEGWTRAYFFTRMKMPVLSVVRLG